MLKHSLLAISLLFLASCQFPFQPLWENLQPAGAYHLPPEYDHIQGVMLSEHLATFPNGRQLLSTLLDQDIEVWMLAVNQTQTQQMSSYLSQRFGLSADELDGLKPLPVATQTVWARDWAPLISYSTSNPQDIGLLDFKYYPDRSIDDAVPQGISTLFNTGFDLLNLRGRFPDLHYKALPVDVELEGGNVMCTDQNCFVSEEVLLRYQNNYGYKPDAKVILAELEKYLDQTFWIVPRMPIEGTGHIDIWAKFLGPKKVIIGEISEESLARVPEDQRLNYTQVKDFLNEQATGKDHLGQEIPNALATILKREHPEIEILRIPMPTPGVYRGIETFRTYTNSILLNDHAILPRYRQGERSRINGREQTQADEERVAQIYQDAGYEVIWILADNLIRDGGAWHCVTMQIPDLQTDALIAAIGQ